jgi:hypothetical protein
MPSPPSLPHQRGILRADARASVWLCSPCVPFGHHYPPGPDSKALERSNNQCVTYYAVDWGKRRGVVERGTAAPAAAVASLRATSDDCCE